MNISNYPISNKRQINNIFTILLLNNPNQFLNHSILYVAQLILRLIISKIYFTNNKWEMQRPKFITNKFPIRSRKATLQSTAEKAWLLWNKPQRNTSDRLLICSELSRHETALSVLSFLFRLNRLRNHKE